MPLVGDVAPSIADRARDLQCDAIVMGTRGLGVIQTSVAGLGRVKVIHLADQPVTLIK